MANTKQAKTVGMADDRFDKKKKNSKKKGTTSSRYVPSCTCSLVKWEVFL